MIQRLLFGVLLLAIAKRGWPEASPVPTKETYVQEVTRGKGLLPEQTAEVSEQERSFRAEMEARKDALLSHTGEVRHPVLYTEDDLGRAKANAAASEWAKGWIDSQVALAEYAVTQPAGWVDSMIPKLSPVHGYGFTCPNCVGKQSQEAVGYELIAWDYRTPEVFKCRACGHEYPDPVYPETATLQMPRSGQSITYYLNPAEQAQPDDRSGRLAWHWVGYPIHVSFSGIVREQKIGFMRDAARSLGFAYGFTGDAKYAQGARDILVRYAQCYRQWLYRDYWDTYADCDPLYAAWHDKDLPLYWKRHLTEQAFARDTVERAAMLQSYWGAGRAHPSTDSVSGLASFALAYDLTCTAVDAAGVHVWSEEQRRLVERDLLLEYMMGAEPFVRGAGKADKANNKSPRV
ncbi:MAG: hypothetical protein HYZ00_01810 [Candidatus Hydrogenedentes bacterium]|nr:hypothetical protein [Candidatus Hydrogenedentota bacterium]